MNAETAELGNPWVVVGILAQCLLLVLLLVRPLLTDWLRRRRSTSSPPPAPQPASGPEDTGRHQLVQDQMATQLQDVHEALGVRRGRPSQLEEYLRAIKDCQKQNAANTERLTQILARLEQEVERTRKTAGAALGKLEALERRAARGNGTGPQG